MHTTSSPTARTAKMTQHDLLSRDFISDSASLADLICNHGTRPEPTTPELARMRASSAPSQLLALCFVALAHESPVVRRGDVSQVTPNTWTRRLCDRRLLICCDLRSGRTAENRLSSVLPP
jgi:hypothetical protein